tara:strand:- start:145 stop:471 length:327 start_codon:yes stop_codon:yes gene_type:complete
MNRRLIIIIITGIIIEILCVAIASIGDIKKNIPCFAFLYTASFIAYLFVVFYVSRNGEISEQDGNSSREILWVIIIFSLIFRFTLLPMIPTDDMYRYLWEGKVTIKRD